MKGGPLIVAVAGLLLGGCHRQEAAAQAAQGAGGGPASRPSAAALRDSKIPPGAVKVTPKTDRYPPRRQAEGWDDPLPLPWPVNTAGGEDSPFILPDGKTLYFWFTPDVSIPAQKQLFDGVTGLYVVRRGEKGWGDLERLVLQDPDKLALDGGAFVQGQTIWFCSAREGYTGVNYFTAQFQGGRWRNWRYVGDLLMKTYQMGEMHITADGNSLYFHSPRPGGKGGYDIWVCRKTADGTWGQPQNVEAVNSPVTDGWPFVTQDGGELWFTRWHHGSPAIFRSRRAGENWQAPQLILSQFAAEPSLDNEGNIYFAHHYFKDGKMIEADLYVAKRRK